MQQVHKVTVRIWRSSSYSSSPFRKLAQDLIEGLSISHFVLRLALDKLEDLHPVRLWNKKGWTTLAAVATRSSR